jgi:hypothetical protein
MDKKNKTRKPKAGQKQAVKSGMGDYFPAMGIGAVIILLAFTMPRFFKVEPSTPQEISQNGIKSFYNDCVALILRSGEILPSCASLEAIEMAYQVNPVHLLVREQGRMIDTARKIAGGDVTNESELRQCMKKNECVKVPGLNFDIEIGTASGKAAQAEFWHLVNDGSITSATCEMTDICRAMVKAGLYPQPAPLNP